MTDESTPRITALTPAQAARILAAAGQRRITEAMVKADVEAGAPTNADGTLNLIHYAAWLARRWNDPAFPRAFPYFNTERYWGEHILALREQAALLQEPPLRWD